jgi:adenylosuccinate synthase
MPYDKEGKINIIGSGVVFYPKACFDEIADLKKAGLSYNNLRIAYNAKLTLPTHPVLDRAKELSKEGRIGTTGKGITPTYVDFVARQGLIINDLFNKDVFVKKLRRHLEEKEYLLKRYDPSDLKKILNHSHLENGIYIGSGDKIFNEEAIIDRYLEYAKELRPMVADTDSFVRKNLKEGGILLEGAQGLLLSIDFGTYPFVTSSDCSIQGLAKGAGISATNIDLSLGIIKGFYATRVGEGALVDELGNKTSDTWCNGGGSREKEEKLYAHASINDSDEFLQGIAIRRKGREFGATTGRPRRVAWLDLPLLRYSLNYASKDVVLTKLDVLNELEVIKICVAYKYHGPKYYYGGEILNSDSILREAVMDDNVLRNCSPIYKEFPGWLCELKGDNFSDLPENLKNIVTFIQKDTGIFPRIISIGADRDETIIL